MTICDDAINNIKLNESSLFLLFIPNKNNNFILKYQSNILIIIKARTSINGHK